MIFNSMFKTLVGKEVVVELKNDLAMRGRLHSVDQFLNVKLTDIAVADPQRYPHMVRGRDKEGGGGEREGERISVGDEKRKREREKRNIEERKKGRERESLSYRGGDSALRKRRWMYV